MGPAQVLYTIGALAMAAVLSYMMLFGVTTTAQRTYRNEILTQLTGVAVEILEDIGSHAFDNRTREDLYPEQATDSTEFTAAGAFGGVSAATCDTSCMDIDDFHGLTLTRSREGVDFSVDIAVQYVDANNPTYAASSKSFAKEVTVVITNPNIYRFNNPDSLIQIEISRVFSYVWITK